MIRAATCMLVLVATLQTTQPAVSAIYTCKIIQSARIAGYGGLTKPGLDNQITDTNVTLDVMANGGFDIVLTSKNLRYSFTDEGCVVQYVKQKVEVPDIVINSFCNNHISNYMFYTREGVTHLLETDLFTDNQIISSFSKEGICGVF